MGLCGPRTKGGRRVQEEGSPAQAGTGQRVPHWPGRVRLFLLLGEQADMGTSSRPPTTWARAAITMGGKIPWESSACSQQSAPQAVVRGAGLSGATSTTWHITGSSVSVKDGPEF